MGWRCRADGGRQDRKQQDFCKKMFEGDWVAQSGPTVHGQGDWRWEPRENRPGWGGGVPALSRERGTDEEKRTNQGRTALGSRERGECGKQRGGGMGSAGLRLAGEGRGGACVQLGHNLRKSKAKKW